jgi:hypothetical protein
MATPHVSGAAALLLSACALNTSELKSALMVNVTPVAAMAGLTVTGGRLNVNNAIRVCPPIANPVPVLSSIAPANAVVGTPPPVMILNGSKFVSGSQVRVDGMVRPTTFVSSTQLTMNLTAGDVATMGARWLSVFSAAPGGGTSAAIGLNVIPVPTISVNGSTAARMVNPGTALTVGINGGPGNATDWVGLFATGAGDAQSLEWRYLNGLTTLPATGQSNANVPFTVPTQPGTYEIRLYGKGWVRMATGATLTVSTASRLEAAPTPTLTAPASIAAGAALQVLLASGPANTTDWVGLFTVGATDQQSLQWQYLNGQTIQPAAGISSATLQFAAPSQTGSYEVRLYAKGWVRLATSSLISVTSGASSSPSPGSSPSLTPLKLILSPGAAIDVVLANGPGAATDWVGLFAVGAADPQALQWQYLNGLTTLPSVGVSNGSVHFTAPLQNGSYEVRLYAKGYVRLATSAVINVAASSVSLTASPTSRQGGTIQVVLTNGPGTATDWVGLFPLGAGDAQSVQWQYLNGQTTLPVAGISNASLAFVGPPPGSYQIRLYAKGYVRLATSDSIIVAP